MSLNYSPTFRLTRFLTTRFDFTRSNTRIRSYAFAGLTIALMAWGIAGAFYAHKVRLLERQLQQAQNNRQQVPPTAAHAIVSYALIPDGRRIRGDRSAGIPEISLQLHSAAVGLELPLSRIVDGASYSAELKTFAGEQTLLTQNFLQPMQREDKWVVEIVLPTDLLRSDTYYTVHLHSPDTTDHFTFKVVAGR